MSTYGPHRWMKTFLKGQPKTNENIYRAYDQASSWRAPNVETGAPQILDELKEWYENHWLDTLAPHHNYEEVFYLWWRKQQGLYACDVCHASPDHQWCELCQVFPERLTRAGCEVCLESVSQEVPKPIALHFYVDLRTGYIHGLLCTECRSLVRVLIQKANFIQEASRFIERNRGWLPKPPPEEELYITVKKPEVLVDGKPLGEDNGVA